jgi:undecaprenyl-diphosphatase
MRPAEGALPLRHALALGLLHGPAELLPVSSSGHTTLVPWLAGWPYATLDGELRKSFEVALHAGAGVALAIELRGELAGQAKRMDRRRAVALALAIVPPALAGLTLRRPIERRLGGPRSIALGLAAGAVAMAIADVRPTDDGRGCEDARECDGLALGIAQAAALIPGVSRNGATLTAARARGFDRGAAQALSWSTALPVIVGASVLQAGRLARRGVPRETRAALLTGGGAAFVSTLASSRVLGRRGRSGQSLLPYSLYRCLLAAVVLTRLRRAH